MQFVDFANKIFARLSDIFRSMTPAGRMTAAILLVVIIVSLAYLSNHPLLTSDGYLFGGDAVSASQLPAIEAAFGKKNLTDYELRGNRIRVPQGKQSIYMAALADAGALPHNFLDSLKTSLDSGGPFVDRKKREELIKVALQDELSKIIGQMNGIERATVLYNIEAADGFNAKKQITAAVTVKPAGNQTLSPEQVQMIRQAVGPAIGAAPDGIAVVDINGRAYPAGQSGGSDEMFQDRYLSMKHQYEREYGESIRQALLSFVKGAVVTVNVELHPELEESESTDRFDPARGSADVPETNKSAAPTITLPSGLLSMTPPSGAPNSPLTVGEGGKALRADVNPAAIRRDSDSLSRESHQVRKAGLTPKRVSVSVGVPSSYYLDVWRQRNPSPAVMLAKKPDADAMAQIERDVNTNIKRCVLGIIPIPENSASDPVTVTSFTSMPIAEIEKPTQTDQALVWITDHANPLGIALLAIISLMILRSIIRSIAAAAQDNSPATAPGSADAVANEMTDHRSAPALLGPRHRRPKGATGLRNELVEIVREDPDAAASVLRNWIGTSN
jgi:flagellar M-ring protein FliF